MKRPSTLSRLTPWVGRLMVANAAVLVLLQTVFTAPEFMAALEFDSTAAVSRPWSFLTYMFAHGGLLHLGGNLLLLLVFGPSVERRLGGRAFILYYLYCGIGAAAFAAGLTSFTTVLPMIGSSGAVLGVALAFALAWPDADTVLHPLPLHLSARALVTLLAIANLLLALWAPDGAAHLGYFGGLGAAYLFYRLQALGSHARPAEPRNVSRRPVLAPMPARLAGGATEPRAATARTEQPAPDPLEVDQVLDKISAFGIQSLTPEERRFLDEVAKRKRKDPG